MLTKRCRRTRGRESGQMLIMALMLLVLLLGFGAIVVDVGFYLHRRERVQHITDAAALAGAQELPEDRVIAEDIAREWADRNGLDGNTIDVSFECRPDNPCDPSGANTIKVTGEMKAPLTLMPVLRLLGGASDSCWLNDGCTVAGTAAAEALTAVAPTDIVLILDRTRSMSDGDMDNARDGARTMLEVLNPELQSVGLGVLPPSISQSFWWNRVCQPDTSGQSGNWPDHWMVADLSDDYKRSDGSLNDSSRLVRVLNCLRSDGYTNIGYPIRAAREHLLFSSAARDDAQKAIVLLTDGAANRPQGQNPCALADYWASRAKDDGIEVYVIGYGVSDPGTGQRCDEDRGAWRNHTSEELVNSMATDPDHAFIEPAHSDLTDEFEEIGQRLSSGFRLVE